MSTAYEIERKLEQIRTETRALIEKETVLMKLRHRQLMLNLMWQFPALILMMAMAYFLKELTK